MEKRMILAIVLSVAVIFLYQYLFTPAPPEKGQPPAGPPAAAGPGVDNARIAPPAGALAQEPPAAMAPRREVPVRLITVNTPLYSAVVSTGGGGIKSLSLASYKDAPGPSGKPLNILGSGAARPLPLDLVLEESAPAFPLLPVYASDAPATVSLGPGEKTSVLMTWESKGGVRIAREYRFAADAYDFEVHAQVSNGSKGSVQLTPGLELSQEFTPDIGGDSYTFQGLVVEAGKSVKRYDLKDIAKGKAPRLPVGWAAADAKYFALIVIPEKEWTLSRVARIGEAGVRLSLADSPAALGPGESVRISARAFMGPKEYELLGKTGRNLGDLVDYGWFSFLAKPLVWLLKASHRVTRNFGIDIIILTVIIKILFYPLTQRSLASMRKMQELSPILNKLREKYKGDPQRLNQETMNLYKTYKINPLSGCLPMLIQIPVFIALYKGLLVAIELRHSPFLLWINDLSSPEHLWDINLHWIVLPVRVLPLLMGISMFVQQKMTPSGGMDPSQQKIMLLMPVIFTVMFWGVPTGLVLYWLVNNILQIGQQLMYNRQIEAAKAA